MRNHTIGKDAFQPGGLLWDHRSGISYASLGSGGRARILAKGPRAAKRIAELAPASATVAVVDRRQMDDSPSLEFLQAYLGSGEILFDPSGVATRARATRD